MSDSGNKRGSDTNDERDDDQRKRSKYDDSSRLEIRILIPSFLSGSIIGKGGDNIKRIRTEYKINITLPDTRGPERLVIIKSDLPTACNVLSEIISNFAKVTKSKDDDEIRVLFQQSLAGRIIGKSGATIKELREETGAKVKIFMDCCPGSTERAVQICGDTDQIIKCLTSIYTIIEGAAPKGPIVNYNTDDFDPLMANKYGGYVDERYESRGGYDDSRGNRKNGRNGPRGGDRYDTRDTRGVDRYERDRNGGSNSRNNRGERSSPFTRDSRSFLDDIGARSNSHGDILAGFARSNSRENSDKNSSQVSIPKNLAGAILGKGGNRIKQVQHESGTKIKMDDASQDSDDRIITIYGNDDQIQYAQYLLQLMVKKHAGIQR